MAFLENLRRRWQARRREHQEEEGEQLEAEARGETHTFAACCRAGRASDCGPPGA